MPEQKAVFAVDLRSLSKAFAAAPRADGAAEGHSSSSTLLTTGLALGEEGMPSPRLTSMTELPSAQHLCATVALQQLSKLLLQDVHLQDKARSQQLLQSKLLAASHSQAEALGGLPWSTEQGSQVTLAVQMQLQQAVGPEAAVEAAGVATEGAGAVTLGAGAAPQLPLVVRLEQDLLSPAARRLLLTSPAGKRHGTAAGSLGAKTAAQSTAGPSTAATAPSSAADAPAKPLAPTLSVVAVKRKVVTEEPPSTTSTALDLLHVLFSDGSRLLLPLQSPLAAATAVAGTGSSSSGAPQALRSPCMLLPLSQSAARGTQEDSSREEAIVTVTPLEDRDIALCLSFAAEKEGESTVAVATAAASVRIVSLLSGLSSAASMSATGASASVGAPAPALGAADLTLLKERLLLARQQLRLH